MIDVKARPSVATVAWRPAGSAAARTSWRDHTPHAFLNFLGAVSAAWWAMQDIAGDLTDRFSSVVQQRR
ncbi:MAG TPA: hypothetical protein VFL71_10055 [Actinomycetes bacterium]|nr:hypothetical protein [Actinomycetes bacterium]